ncbi:inverse autotransporter beta domain-containing protein [Moellerella wisconsensis]|uniref:Ig-like domain-containing protein n=2 Tax=Moellerella wisconsensis TaxID=158849 RepID=UPI001F4D733A|nr:inverse autotransporter beta domain-containing protein [Moellerella wisconsensis]UNH43802.1 inverse autotransporter beta domain-containing protein [Moellerella wisconsensis]
MSTQTDLTINFEKKEIISLKNNQIETKPYTLKINENTSLIAKQYGLTAEELKLINIYRTFSKPFEQLSLGDVIDVPKKILPYNQILKPNNNEISPIKIENNITKAISLLKNNSNIEGIVEDKSKDYILNNANKSVHGWLSKFGTAKGSFTIDNNYSLKGSELDLLIPFYDSEQILFYTQLGGRYKNDRTTLNSGLGTRIFIKNNWMLGSNIFFDADITGRNQRLGLGIEAWRDYLKLSANQYIGLTNWHQSRDFTDYNERPANGFDIRAEGYLSFYPHIGANLVYEVYQGDQVAIFDKNERQKDPYAFTLGANYTPFSLVTVGIDHRMGKSHKEDTLLNLQINYRFGESLQNQLSGTYVDNIRQLSQSRYELVNRNNEIVLDYKKQELIKLSLPKSKTGHGGDKILVTALVSSKYIIKSINWDDSNFPTGGITTHTGKEIVEVILPDYDYNGKNTYQLKANAADINGNNSNTASMLIIVTAPSLESSILTLSTDKNNAIANENDAIIATAILTDSNGAPIEHQKIEFNVDNAILSTIEGETDSKGSLTTQIRSNKVVDTIINANLKNISGKNAYADISFVADSTTAKIDSLVVIQDNAIANGIDTNSVKANVTDSAGNPVTDQTVTFSATNGATVITDSVHTDNLGTAVTTLTNTLTGISQVTASTNSTTKTADVTFVADSTTAKIDSLVVIQDNAIANGIDTNSVKANVTDSAGNPVTDQTVTFSATNGATVITDSVHTDNLGTAVTTLTNTLTGISQVTASTNSTTKTADVTFVADSTTAKIDSLVVIQDNAIANGIDTNSVKANVTDSAGNPVTDQTVTFSATNGATVITDSVHTDNLGTAVTTLTNTLTGISQVTASTNSTTKTADVTFVADSTTAKIDSLVVIQNNALANGIDTNSVKANVTDSAGNPVTDQTVTFSATNGATVITDSVHTDNLGTAVTTLTNTLTGISQVTASTNGTTKTADVTFIADSTTAKIDSLVVIQDNALANGIDTNSVKANVTDSAGNPVTDQTVTFSATNGATVITDSVHTDNLGTAVTTLTNTLTGISQVTASTNSTNKTADVTFKREPIDIKIDSVNVNKAVYQIATPGNSIFPNSGFKNAKFQILINGKPSNKNKILWKSSHSNNANVDNNGFVTLLQKSNEKITITAQDKEYPNNKSEFTFIIKNWFLYSDTPMMILDAHTWCNNNNSDLVILNRLTSATLTENSSPVRQPNGVLWDEWGNLTAYGLTSYDRWSSEVSGSDRRAINARNGLIIKGQANPAGTLCVAR